MTAEQEQIFVLCVWLKFASVADRDEFIHKFWAPLAEYVKAQEHGTLAYEIAIADSDPLKIQVFERYQSKAYFTDVHQTSEPYLAFKAAQAPWRKEHAVEVTGQSYYETGIGHMAR
ncbi:hypothetical protein COHA_008628 [Chlorella ohadii]|uniref:ABM domain-containing protein n=1 Tax=Chlorella ohadii TaxID=2649997 RepID=A0AAD5DJX4_9CHLO|nr:hypothetical protein COHA_008628 [Chlorella ohadii]